MLNATEQMVITPTRISVPRQGTWLHHSSEQGMKISTELSPDPLISSFPTSAVQENVVSVLSYVLHQVIRKPEVSSCWVQDLTEFWVVDLYMGIFYLFEIIPRVNIYLNKTAYVCYYILLPKFKPTVSQNIKKKQMAQRIMN